MLIKVIKYVPLLRVSIIILHILCHFSLSLHEEASATCSNLAADLKQIQELAAIVRADQFDFKDLDLESLNEEQIKTVLAFQQ